MCVCVISSEKKETNNDQIRTLEKEKRCGRVFCVSFIMKKKRHQANEHTHWIWAVRIFYVHGFIVQIKNNHLLLFISVIWIGEPHHWWTKCIKQYFSVNLLVVCPFLFLPVFHISIQNFVACSRSHAFGTIFPFDEIVCDMQFYLLNME